MVNKIDSILKQVLQEIEPPREDIEAIEEKLKEFIEGLEKKIKSQKAGVEIFIGGSYAKKTLIKKGKYDIDIFLRFDSAYREKNISDIAKKLLKSVKDISVIHGSRDYF